MPSHHCAQPPRPQSGFTLIEALVVIAVIGVLVGLLLPMLSGARSAARMAKCAATQRSLGQCVVGFMGDHRDQGPVAGRLWNHTLAQFTPAGLPRGLSYYWQSGPGSVKRPLPFFATLAEYAGIEFDTSSIDEMRRQLGFPGPEHPASARFFSLTRCPDDRTFDRGQLHHIGNTLLPNDLGWTVSGGLGEMSSFMINEWATGAGAIQEERLLGQLFRVQHPSSLSLLCDGEPRLFEPPAGINYQLYFDDEITPGFTLLGYNQYFQGFSPPEHFARGIYYQFGFPIDPEQGVIDGPPRHRWSINTLFVDGHVGAVRLSEDGLSRALISQP